VSDAPQEASSQFITPEIVGKGIDATVTEGIEETAILLPLSKLNGGIDETVAVEATVKSGIDEIVTVDPSANAVPELLDPSDVLLTALLHTERTTAKVHTSNSDQRRFFQDSDMIDPLIDVNKPPPTPAPFPRDCTVE